MTEEGGVLKRAEGSVSNFSFFAGVNGKLVGIFFEESITGTRTIDRFYLNSVLLIAILTSAGRLVPLTSLVSDFSSTAGSTTTSWFSVLILMNLTCFFVN